MSDMDSSLVGESPGVNSLFHNGSCFAPVPSTNHVVEERPVDEDISPSVDAPTVHELFEALNMATSVDMQSNADCFRVLFRQNSVLLREAICRRRLWNGVASGQSSASSSLPNSGGDSGDSGGSHKKVKLAPPAKVFQCPVCPLKHGNPILLNEKDFARHVEEWPERVERRVEKGCCSGFQDINHPLLSAFAGTTLLEKVSACSKFFRSLVRPGAYDALLPEGSGRHILVAQRVFELMQHERDQ
jgi:hypothetical protein